MRKELKNRESERTRFRGQFEKFGRKSGFRGRILTTILLLDISDVSEPNKILTDHLWFNLTAEFASLNLRAGDIVEFNARVRAYEKGYREDDEENPKRIDYHLSHPRKIERIGHIDKDFAGLDKYNEEVLAEIKLHESRRIEGIKAYIESKQKEVEEEKKEPEKVNRDRFSTRETRNRSILEFLRS